jgi:predicted GH43/DUF377 family glycosyl hydrolase
VPANILGVKRAGLILKPDQSRVLLRPFDPGDEKRAAGIVTRILALPEEQVAPLVDSVCLEFCRRHRNITKVFLDRFEQVRELTGADDTISNGRKLLIGSYFLAEYSLESAALFNPSIVPHPDQSNLLPGELRFILSLRATGEGHISSITFRVGVIHADNEIEVLAPVGFVTEPTQVPNSRYEKALFARKLAESGAHGDFKHRVLDGLPDPFSLEELRTVLQDHKDRANGGLSAQDLSAARGIWMLAKSNYEVQFQPDQQFCERVIFPATPSQKNGIEDARFVRFQKDDGTYTYFATFTAFDGRIVMPELVETSDFLLFRFITLNGPAARDKGLALFPRMINGQYMMLSRQENENICLMSSDNVHFWNECKELLKPQFPWELVQLGNCGSPIETDAGWLVLSHGVGPVRQYGIGAFLLDREDPSKVLGRLREPLLKPDPSEREGYVPNVVYTCGALVHNGTLIMPYGLADHATKFATVPLKILLAELTAD